MDIKITKPEGIVLSLTLSADEASDLIAGLDYAAAHTLAYTAVDRLVSALADADVQPTEGLYE